MNIWLLIYRRLRFGISKPRPAATDFDAPIRATERRLMKLYATIDDPSTHPMHRWDAQNDARIQVGKLQDLERAQAKARREAELIAMAKVRQSAQLKERVVDAKDAKPLGIMPSHGTTGPASTTR